MDIWEADRLGLFITFVVPGFISIKVYQLLFPGSQRAVSDQLVDAVAYSCLNYAALFWLVVIVEDSRLKDIFPALYYAFYLLLLLVAPAMWVLLWRWLRTREFFQRNAPHPIQKPWDYVFQQRHPFWMIVYLRSGAVVGGKFHSGSFASSSPASEQIYIEESWLVEEGVLVRPLERSEGVIVMSEEISHIELFSYEEVVSDGEG
jgi:hypothetical protein